MTCSSRLLACALLPGMALAAVSRAAVTFEVPVKP
jgi:hypothetical protein